MMERGSFFAPHDAFEERFIPEHDALKKIVDACRTFGLKIVLTSGSFDLPHIGHMRYLREARKLGDFLIVGIDSDEKVRSRKRDQYRPVIPELERAELIAHSRYADVITLKLVEDEQWGLIKLVHPDVLVVSERNDSDEKKLAAIKEFCGEIVVLKSQATSSTSASIRKLQTGALIPCLKQIRDLADSMITKTQKGDGA